jgi:hypothetical protein
MTVTDFIERMKANKSVPLYAKDVSCPSAWRNTLMDSIVPHFLAYMGNNDLSKSYSHLPQVLYTSFKAD